MDDGELLNLLDDASFPSCAEFIAQYGDMTSATQVTNLTTSLRPYLLRRTKGDVDLGLTPMEETLVTVEITNRQKELYRALLSQNALALAHAQQQQQQVGEASANGAVSASAASSAGGGVTASLSNVFVKLRQTHADGHRFHFPGVVVDQITEALHQLPCALQIRVRQNGDKFIATIAA